MTTTDVTWHFTGDKLRDRSPIPAIGHTLVYPGKIEMCRSGYHWSRTPWQALNYAPGCMLHKVRVGGEVVEDYDKGVSSERTILATIDATQLLRRFAADQALSVAHLWPMPDVVRKYLTGLGESKRAAARDAAWAAAGDAAWASARAAAGDAAWTAAWTAAWDAAWASARAAAGDAAWTAAWTAAWDAAWASARAAAWDAAWDAAGDAAWAAAGKEFNARVYKAFEAMECRPLPRIKSAPYQSKYPFNRMEIGESVFIPCPGYSKKEKRADQAAWAIGRLYGRKFTRRRTVENGVDGIRIWRVE